MTSNLNLIYVTRRALKLGCNAERNNISRYWRDSYSSNSSLPSRSIKVGERATQGLFQVLWTQESGLKKSIDQNASSRGVRMEWLHVAGYWPSDCWPLRESYFPSNPCHYKSWESSFSKIIDYLITREIYESRARGLKKNSKYAES